MITSLSNQQLKNVTLLLKKSKERREQGLFVSEGRKMFLEALELGRVKQAYVSEKYVSEYGEPQCSFEIVANGVFESIAETVTPQGVIALVDIPKFNPDELLENANSLVVAENLQDPGNLGTILRTAEAAGMDGVILSADSVDVFNPKVVRSTMGAIFRVPVVVVNDISSFVNRLNDAGFNTIAAHLSGKIDYMKADYSGKVAVLIGNEGNGLKEETTQKAREKVIIPMEGQAESLNASVAAALMMYEIKRNRYTGK